MSDAYTKGNKVVSRDGTETGTATGSTHRCQLEGCSGVRIATRWPKGNITFPCSRGMIWDKKRKAWRIQ